MARSRVVWVAMAALVTATPLGAQVRWERGDQGWCDDDWGGRNRERFCEVLTATVPSTGRLEVDAGRNGGIDVQAWDGQGVEIRAKVWATARDEERAQELERGVDVQVRDGRIRANGPDTGRREGWGVSYEIRVPRSTDLDLTASNGGIDVEAVTGEIRFAARNGGVRLVGVGGDVRGHTANGGLHVELDGQSWTGAGLDVETRNGGVRLEIPDDYSAELVTGTVNGNIDIDFPVTVQGHLGRQIRTTLGDGGPTIRAVTTNGGVRITRR